MNIPFVDLYSQYLSIRSEIDIAIERVIKNSSFIGGEEIVNFEKLFSEYLGFKHTVSCANGTDSIEIILEALGIGNGDEVIVPAISWISTSEAVSRVGATPIFVDIEPDYFTIDTAKIEEKITSKTKAIIPVHLYGHPCNMSAITEIAKAKNIFVIEDCAQAHGAKWKGNMAGTFGIAASFSFYPGKNLGAYGDAGAMVTNDSDLARKLKRIANHGQEGKHNHIIEGRNSRLDGLHAAILSVKIKHLNKWTISRQLAAEKYSNYIKSNEILLPKTHPDAEHVFHLYVIRHNKRENVIQHLEKLGISTAIHYPKALPFLKCYEHFNSTSTDYPVASDYQNKILSLPIYAELTEKQIEYISKCLNELA
jgi:dTDP-4-amino-4,6-dideoxygalactose transaminase